jgi:hypothetical protein
VIDDNLTVKSRESHTGVSTKGWFYCSDWGRRPETPSAEKLERARGAQSHEIKKVEQIEVKQRRRHEQSLRKPNGSAKWRRNDEKPSQNASLTFI